MTLRVVVDANIVASALIRPEGWTAAQFKRKDVEWIAPAVLITDLLEHASAYAAKAGCSQAVWERRTRSLARTLRTVSTGDLVRASGHPLVQAVGRVDADDAAYAAALVAGKADLLWTRDRAVLQALPGRAVVALPDPAGP